MKFLKETDMGEILVPYLRQNNEVFQEVAIGYGTACDIVFKNNLGKVNCIEMKLHLNLELLCQCARWYKLADFVWIAVPIYEEKKVSRLYRLFYTFGIGVILVNNNESYPCQNIIKYYAKQLNNKPFDWDKYLICEHANDVKAGSRSGKRSTPFSRTVTRIKKYKKHNPEATLEECLKNVKHHYSNLASAKSSIKKLLENKIIKIKGF